MNKLFTIIASTLFITAPVQAAPNVDDYNLGFEVGILGNICALQEAGYLTRSQAVTVLKEAIVTYKPSDLAIKIASESCKRISEPQTTKTVPSHTI